MKTHLTRLLWLRLVVVFGLFAAFLPIDALALNSGVVVHYTPLSQGVDAVLPATSSYVLTVTSPALLTTFPTTVNLRVVSTYTPLNDPVAAVSYVQFSSPTLTFTQANQTQNVTVTLNFPANALTPDVPSGTYTYQIYTDGWPVGFLDGGSGISAGVLETFNPTTSVPNVVIGAPADGSTINISYTSLPLFVPFNFTANSPDTNAVTGVSVYLDGAIVVPTSVTGLGTPSVSGSGTLLVLTPGQHTLTVSAGSAGGTGSDSNTFTVSVAYPPPTVSIVTPLPGSSFTYLLGSTPTSLPVVLSSVALFAPISQISAVLDGNVPITLSASGLNTLLVNATAQLGYTAIGAGPHTIHVIATDMYGMTATADTNFTVTIITPQPVVAISTPTNNQIFTVPAGATTASVPYTFTTSVQSGFNIDSAGASLGATVLAPTITNLGTPTAKGTGTLTLAPGSYTLTATGGCLGISASTSVTFVVKASTMPPSVVIASPPVGYTQAIVPGTTATIPLTFTGTSNTVGGVITKLTATLDGAALSVSSSTIGQSIATGSATMSVTTSGTHHIVVTATDAYGNATATRDFTITLLTSHQISGTVFFDLDGNGVQNGADFGLAFITVQLLNSSGTVLQSAVTNAAGTYTFNGLFPGTYTVVASPCAGLTATTATRQTVTMNASNITAAPMGYRLNFCALQCMRASACSMGFWKTNLSKAISGTTKGAQINAATLTKYTANLSQFALTQFDGLTMKQAVAIMSSNSCDSASLLAKQLLPAEYNYENGAYINGNPTLTFTFVAWGEAVMQNSKSYSSSYLTWAASWFEAYNTTEGGTISGPGSCSGYYGGSYCGGSYDDDDDDSGCSWGGDGWSWGGGCN